MNPRRMYLSGVSLYKIEVSSGAALIEDIGKTIHPDNHAITFDPTNTNVIFAGNDGGIYKFTNGGHSWKDNINKGLCITQFEYMDLHPKTDAVAFGGTQDNGTLQYRNSPVFYHSAGGDGGYVAIDQNDPSNVLHERFGPSLERSTRGGQQGSWKEVFYGIVSKKSDIVNEVLEDRSLFYPPFTLDQSNSHNIAFGTNKIYLDTEQGSNKWKIEGRENSIHLDLDPKELVSAINYVSSNLIYAATIYGKIFRVTKTQDGWNPDRIDDADLLPKLYIWDIANMPNDQNTIVVVMSGFIPENKPSSHIWKGALLKGSKSFQWTDISGTRRTRLPDIPINAVVIEPDSSNNMYVGTDVGVFHTGNGGDTWDQFSEGLPYCPVFDMRIHTPTRILRVITNGRGMWERRLDNFSKNEVNIFVRKNLQDTGLAAQSPNLSLPSPIDEIHEYVEFGDPLWLWMCADIKNDSPISLPFNPDDMGDRLYQMDVTDVDYVAFESKLVHHRPQKGSINHIYVQVHNRGIRNSDNVTVKLLYTNACVGFPDLPYNFWKVFPNNSDDISLWKPLGEPKNIASISITQPSILEWDWEYPLETDDNVCFLVIVDSKSDPISSLDKTLKVADLMCKEKHIGVKNVHILNIMRDRIYWTLLQFFGNPKHRNTIRVFKHNSSGWTVGLLLQKGIINSEIKLKGMTVMELSTKMLGALLEKIPLEYEKYDTTRLYVVNEESTDYNLSNMIFFGGIFRINVAPHSAFVSSWYC